MKNIQNNAYIHKKIMVDYGLCLMNKKLNWFRDNEKSLIDPMTTNMHPYIDNITTILSGISDRIRVNFHRPKKTLTIPHTI